MAIVYLGLVGLTSCQWPLRTSQQTSNNISEYGWLSSKADKNEAEMGMEWSLCTTKGNCKQGNSFHSEKWYGEEFLHGLDG